MQAQREFFILEVYNSIPSIPKNDGFVSDFEEPLNFCMDKFDTMELQKKNGYTRFVECSHFIQGVEKNGPNAKY